MELNIISRAEFWTQPDLIFKKFPANAVCCKVLNLLSQVGPDPETPPWLRPIALFLLELETLKVSVGSKRKRNITYTAGT
jgi:hypothetical protein